MAVAAYIPQSTPYWLRSLALCAGLLFGLTASVSAADSDGQILPKTVAQTGAPFAYMIHLPAHYADNPMVHYPLIICLHGVSEQGDGSSDGTLTYSSTNQLAKVLNVGPLNLIKNGSQYFSEHQAIVVQPQEAQNGQWKDHFALDALITHLAGASASSVGAYRIDHERIYLTGFSLGGAGAWEYGLYHAPRLAALVPIAASIPPKNDPTNTYYQTMAALRIWAVHSSEDPVVPIVNTTGQRTGANPDNDGWVGRIARVTQGVPSYRCLDTHPDQPVLSNSGWSAKVTATRSGYYSRTNGWKWQDGPVFTPGYNLQVTIVNSSKHYESWFSFYGSSSPNTAFWDWLLAQRRGQTGTATSVPPPQPNQTPTMTFPPRVMSLAANSANLRVLGNDDGGEANLTYTWTKVSGPGSVTFTPNQTNSAKDSTATFSASGTYTLRAAIRDAADNPITSTVTLAVSSQTTKDGVGAYDTTDDGPGSITVQGEYGPLQDRSKAFDNNPTTTWLDFADGAPAASFIQYKYPFARRYQVTSYALTSSPNAPACDPQLWTLFGSDDGLTWTTIDVRSDEAFASRGQRRVFMVAAPGIYQMYRLRIRSVKDPATADSVRLAEIELIGLRAAMLPDGDG